MAVTTKEFAHGFKPETVKDQRAVFPVLVNVAATGVWPFTETRMAETEA
jgi:hypothetical protein